MIVKTDLYRINKYRSLPCDLQTFTIRRKSADKDDFGVTEDVKPSKAPKYGCGCMKFIKDKRPRKGVLEKYGITKDEWKEICLMLEENLYVGKCGYCI